MRTWPRRSVRRRSSVAGSVAFTGDIRDAEGLRTGLGDAVSELGRLDIVCANAGVFKLTPTLEVTAADWRDIVDVNLTSAWNTCQAAVPHLIETGGGSIVILSSTAGIKALTNAVHYTASKHGVVGIMRTRAARHPRRHSRGASARRARPLLRRARARICTAPADQAADARLRARRLTGGSGRLDRGDVAHLDR